MTRQRRGNGRNPEIGALGNGAELAGKWAQKRRKNYGLGLRRVCRSSGKKGRFVSRRAENTWLNKVVKRRELRREDAATYPRGKKKGINIPN